VPDARTLGTDKHLAKESGPATKRFDDIEQCTQDRDGGSVWQAVPSARPRQ
jgi:hypothetical protein